MNIQTAVRADKAELQRLAREEAYSTPLKDYHPGAPRLFQNDTLWPWFERLRKEEPVHYCTNSPIEPYWSVTKYHDIMHVDTNHGVFSSDVSLGGISIRDVPPGYDWPSFIAMDQPLHSAQRKTVSPMFTPTHLDELAILIRERTGRVLDALPRDETFNFVDRVSIELTTQMLATLFDFPFEERRKLTRWSDVSTALPKSGIVESPEQRRAEMDECAAYFSKLWNERVNAEPRNDLISMMAHNDATRYMDPDNLMGNIILLIVGGNDTTRNSMSAYAWGLEQFPDERAKLEANPALIPNAVQEIIRWQTPLAHMRRTATQDTELEGQQIKAGDKLALWYISANRDESVFGDDADSIVVDRPNARRHLAFGHGIHRCVGARLAEM
ncbi:MAG: cytochrome P450, partial [Bradyrhizobium sp.]